MPKVDDTATLIAKQTITEIQLIEILRYETRKRPEYNHIVGVAIKKMPQQATLGCNWKAEWTINGNETPGAHACKIEKQLQVQFNLAE